MSLLFLDTARATDDVPTLLAQLSDKYQGHYAAMALANIGPSVLPQIIERMQSPDAVTRTWAVRTLTNMGSPKAAPAHEALIAMLGRETDLGALCTAVQAAGFLKPDVKRVVPLLTAKLEHAEIPLQHKVSEVLGLYGPDATSAKPLLIHSILVRELQVISLRSLQHIGLDDNDAAALEKLAVRDDSVGAQEIFHTLLHWPVLAQSFVERHPKLLASLPKDDVPLIELFGRDEPASVDLRKFLTGRADLPRFIRVDFSKGERIGFVQTWPRDLDPTLCFPQRPMVVKIVGDHAKVASFLTDEDRKLWDNEGLVAFAIDKKWGMIDTLGKIIVTPAYDDINPCSDGRIIVYNNDHYGVIDTEGNVIVEPKFEWAYSFSKGIAAVNVGGKYGFINRDGSWLVQPMFKRVDPAGEGWRIDRGDGKERDMTSWQVRTTAW